MMQQLIRSHRIQSAQNSGSGTATSISFKVVGLAEVTIVDRWLVHLEQSATALTSFEP